MSYNSRNDRDDNSKKSFLRRTFFNRKFLIALLLLAAIILPVMGLLTSYSVGVSQVGILVNPISGEISKPQPGPFTQFFAKAPWVNVVIISTSIQQVDMWSHPDGAPYPDVSVLSKDNLEVGIALSLRYQVDASKAVSLYKSLPALNFKDPITSIVRSDVRTELAQFNAAQLQEVRAQMESDLTASFDAHFASDPTLAGAIHLVALNLREINLPAEFLSAIQAKLNAQQGFIQASFDAQKILVLANATANAQILQSIGIAKSQLIIANATAESINLIAAQTGLNATSIAQLYIFMQMLNTIAATGANVNIILGTSNGTFFLINPTP